MTTDIKIEINGHGHRVKSGTTVAVAILDSGALSFRRSVSGQPRSPLCGMGVCYECRVTINGSFYERSCMILCRPGMKVETQ